MSRSSPPRRKLTPKQRVLRKYPKAYAHSFAGPAWVIYTGEYVNQSLNAGDRTPQQAWAEAAIAEIKRPLDEQMARLNATVTRLNEENAALRANGETGKDVQR